MCHGAAFAQAGLSPGGHLGLHQHPEPSHSKSRSASGISSRNSSNTSILSLAIAATSFIFGADEGDEVALVLPTLLVSYTTSWNTILYHMGSLARETLAECVLCWWHRSIRHYDV